MTNEEVEIKYFPCILDPQYNNKFKIGVFHKSMNEARADEREKVIKEIEEWARYNNFYAHEYMDDVVDLSYLRTKLNSLREAK